MQDVLVASHHRKIILLFLRKISMPRPRVVPVLVIASKKKLAPSRFVHVLRCNDTVKVEIKSIHYVSFVIRKKLSQSKVKKNSGIKLNSFVTRMCEVNLKSNKLR